LTWQIRIWPRGSRAGRQAGDDSLFVLRIVLTCELLAAAH
jgi:hypothetical protein